MTLYRTTRFTTTRIEFSFVLRNFSENQSKNTRNVQKGVYQKLEEAHVDFFNKTIGVKNVLRDTAALEKYNVDFMKNLKGQSNLVLKPRTTEEVSKILHFCNNNLLATCIQGGNTGLCAGATPVFDEIVVSTERLDNILHLDEISGVLTCEAGCILQNLDDFLDKFGLMMPIDLGARGSCRIGGNVSTNAGGMRLYRYGNLHRNITGLEIVKADGEIIDYLNSLKKDNTGYDLKQIFIGSEGCLGFITKVAIQCAPKSNSLQLAFLGAQKFTKVLKAFEEAKKDLGEIISAVEVMDHEAMKFVENYGRMTSPIGDYPIYFLLETSGGSETHDQEKLNKYLEKCLNKHIILNGVVESSPSKVKELWSLRDRVGEFFHVDGYDFSFDISLPLKYYFDFVNDVRDYMGNKARRVFGFGHLGDGNLHLQVCVPEYSEEIAKHVETYVYEKVKDLRGSISAEHGIGFFKRKHLPSTKTENCMTLMRDLKKVLDPNGILNPYKVL